MLVCYMPLGRQFFSAQERETLQPRARAACRCLLALLRRRQTIAAAQEACTEPQAAAPEPWAGAACVEKKARVP